MFTFRPLLCAFIAASALASGAASAADRRVEVFNKTGHTLTAFHASRASTTDWEENIIAGRPLRSGSSVVVDINDGTGSCKFDFLGRFADGDEVISNGNDVCTLEEFTFE